MHEGNGGSGQEKGGLRARGKRVVGRPEGEAAAGEREGGGVG